MGKQFFFWFLDWVLDRLDEASTWRAIIIILGLVGVNIKPEAQELIVQAGLLLFGGIHLMPDKFDTFSKLKPDRTAKDSTPTCIDTKPTSEERYNRFKQAVDRAEQRFNPVEESKVPNESGLKSVRNETVVKSGDDFPSSGWNG